MTTVSKKVTHKINMGDYENLTLEVFYTTEIPEGVKKETVLDEVDAVIKDALEDDIKQARTLCDPNSYIIQWRNQ